MRIPFLACFLFLTASGYEVPDAIVEAYSPRGFKVSIPDEEGIKLFAFHGKLNEEMNGREGGTFSQDILKAKDGFWTFYDPNTKLKVGDILYFWTYVDYFDGKNKLGYPRDDQYFTVTKLLPKPGAPPPPTTTKKPKKPKPNNGNGNGNENQPNRIKDQDNCKEQSETTVNGSNKCKGEVIFEEDFKEIHKSVWNFDQIFADAPDYEFVVYSAGTKALKTENNQLVIKPVLMDDIFGVGYITNLDNKIDLGVNCTGILGTKDCVRQPNGQFILPPVLSSRINTRNKFSFKYGKIEIKAKLPKGDWIYPELFLQSNNQEYGQDYECGQMRIAFTGGNEDLSHTLYGGVILGESTAARNYGMKKFTIDKPWTNFVHVYTLNWTPESITMSVDGKIYGVITPPPEGFASEKDNLRLKNVEKWKEGSPLAPFDKEMFIAIGVGVGGHNFVDHPSKPWKNTDPLNQRNFYKAQSNWSKTWGDHSALVVESIKITAI